MKKYLFIFFYFFLSQLSVYSQQADENVVHSLNDDWLVFDKSSEGFVPYIEDKHRGVRSYYLLFDASPYQRYKMKLGFNAESSIFINNKLIYQAVDGEDELVLDIDSLLSKEEETTLLLTIFDKQKSGVKPNADVVKRGLQRPLVERFSQSYYERDARAKTFVLDNMVVLCVALFVVMAIFGKWANLRLDRVTLAKLGETLIKGRKEQDKLTGLSVVAFIVSYSMVGGFVILLSGREHHLFFAKPWAEEGEYFFWGHYLSVTTVVLVSVLMKLVLIFFIGKAYDSKQITPVHIQSYVEITQVFVVISLIFGGVWLFNKGDFPYEIFSNVLIFSFLLNSFLVSLSVLQQIPFRNKYIISYFCATEFLPILLVVKIFM